MNPRHRDGVLAVLGLAGLVTVVTATTGPGALLDPRAVAVGVLGAVTVELAFLRYPERTLAVWERPGVPVAALAALFVSAVVAVRYVPWLVPACCWGLVVYLVLLACVLAGLGNPLAPLAGNRER